MLSSDTLRRWLPALGTAIPLIVLFIAVLSILLAAAQQMRLSEAETSSWILVVYGLPGLLGLVLVIRYRQPLLLTGNVFVLIFIASLGARLSYPELVGASIVAGASVVLISALGLTGRLAAWTPRRLCSDCLLARSCPSFRVSSLLWEMRLRWSVVRFWLIYWAIATLAHGCRPSY